MQRITQFFFGCAGSNFRQKLKKFHHLHSHEGKIDAYDTDSRVGIKSRIENVLLPVLCKDGSDTDGGMSVCKIERESGHARERDREKDRDRKIEKEREKEREKGGGEREGRGGENER